MRVFLKVYVRHETFNRYYRRAIDLPVVFPGLTIFGAEKLPDGCDSSETTVESVYYDVATGELTAFLGVHDFREEKSGDEWSPEEVESHFDGWAVEGLDFC